MTNRRRGARWLVAAVVASTMGLGVAHATTIIPMSDEDLVGSSDLIAIGAVTDVTTGRTRGGRIVTHVALAVERMLKGRIAGTSIRLTEPGGVAGDRRLTIAGAPTYTAGEQVLVFARSGSDGSLHTNSLVLGQYRIAGAGARARRALPVIDERDLHAFVARIESLVGSGPQPLVPDGRVDGALAAPFQVAANGEFPGRWFEADCDIPVAFSLGNVDPVLGETATRTALAAALAAWTDAPQGALTLTVGPDAPVASFEAFDGVNGVAFEDPFNDIEDDLVNCTGVLAIGGFSSSKDFGTIMVNDQTFERILEGDVVVNVGTSACINEAGVAEVLTHEIGHAIGFGHASEDPVESDPLLLDAVMYFLLPHADDRGAALGADDLAGLAFIYPPPVSIDLVTDAITSYSCLFSMGLAGIQCAGETLPAAPFKKFEKAGRKAKAALGKPTPKKQRKLLRKSRKLVLQSDKKATNLFGKEKIPAGCFADMQSSTSRALERADAAIAAIEANL